MASRKKPTRTKYYRVWRSYFDNCRRKGIRLELSPDQVEKLAVQPCFYCEAPPSNCRFGVYYSGIDRKDNKKGYTTANCVPCCHRCNSVKGNKLSFEQMCYVGRTLRVLDCLKKK